jgi:hypothetical protein
MFANAAEQCSLWVRPDKETRAAMLTVAVQEDIADVRPVS